MIPRYLDFIRRGLPNKVYVTLSETKGLLINYEMLTCTATARFAMQIACRCKCHFVQHDKNKNPITPSPLHPCVSRRSRLHFPGCVKSIL
jgi:hypothetical protein